MLFSLLFSLFAIFVFGRNYGSWSMSRDDDECVVGLEYDYIIIGAGTGGAVVTAKLSEDPDNSVLLIEEGGWSNQWSIINSAADWFSTLSEPQLDRSIYSEPETELYGRINPWPRAKVTGGCDSHNAMVYYLGNRNDIDERWQVDDWYWDDLSPYWNEVDAQYRTTVVDTSDSTWIAEFLAAAAEQGYTYTDTPNDLDSLDPDTAYNSIRIQTAVNIDGFGQRTSVWTEYIEPILPRNNLDILVYSRVNKLLFEPQNGRSWRYRRNYEPKVNGVEVYGIGDDRITNIYANKEVIVSGGVFESPKILMLSGIGDCDYLESMSIDCVSNVPGVGQNLQDHTYGTFVSPPFTNNDLDDIDYPTYQKSVFGLYGTLNVGENNDYYCGLDISGTNGSDVNIQIGMEVFQYAARGEVLLTDTDPASPPLVYGNFLSGEGDFERFIYTFRKCRDLMYSSNLAAYYTSPNDEVSPGWDIQTDEEIMEYARNVARTDWHPGCTCKMGDLDEDEMAVVNNRLQVRGVKNLRVVDGSIMPSMISGNPNQITMIIAAKAADLILEDN